MKKLYRSLATAGGIGLLPLAPGTWAALAAAIVWYMVKSQLSVPFQTEVLVNLLIAFSGILSSSAVISDWGKDPSKVVIDEVSGMSIALITIPANIMLFSIAIILFRFFDIAKPLGIRNVEKAGGGWGIMLDDIIAGFYSLIVLKLIILSDIIG